VDIGPACTDAADDRWQADTGREATIEGGGGICVRARAERLGVAPAELEPQPQAVA
jgi:hypothetical protein